MIRINHGRASAPSTNYPLDNDAVTPTISFGDGDTGFYELEDDSIGVSISGARRFIFHKSFAFQMDNANGAAIINEAASDTNPSLLANKSDLDTGIGHQAADNLSLVSGGIEAIRAEDPADLAATETSLWIYDLDNGAIQQVTVGIADSGGAGFKLLRIVN